MAGPFPGMDLYLEWQSAWSDFLNCLIAGISNDLGARLPDSYVARIDQRIEVASSGIDPPSLLVPTLCVGMPSWTLRVLFAQPEDSRFERRQTRATRSVGYGIPTRNVGTSVSILVFR